MTPIAEERPQKVVEALGVGDGRDSMLRRSGRVNLLGKDSYAPEVGEAHTAGTQSRMQLVFAKEEGDEGSIEPHPCRTQLSLST